MSLINDALRRAREAEKNQEQRPSPLRPLQPVDGDHRPPSGRSWVLAAAAVAALILCGLLLWRWVGGSDSAEPTVADSEPSTMLGRDREAMLLAGGPDTERTPPSRRPQPTLPVPTNELPSGTSATAGSLAALPPAQGQSQASDPMLPESPTGVEPTPSELEKTSEGIAGESVRSTNATQAPTATSTPGGLSETVTVEPVSEPVVTPREVPQGPEFRLQSIIYRFRNPSVNVNGKFLQVGDSISGARVTEIQRHSVTLRRDGTNIVLELNAL